MEPKHERKVAVEYWYVSENQGGKLEIRLSNLDYMRIPRNPAWSIFNLHQVVPTRFPPPLLQKTAEERFHMELMRIEEWMRTNKWFFSYFHIDLGDRESVY